MRLVDQIPGRRCYGETQYPTRVVVDEPASTAGSRARRLRARVFAQRSARKAAIAPRDVARVARSRQGVRALCVLGHTPDADSHVGVGSDVERPRVSALPRRPDVADTGSFRRRRAGSVRDAALSGWRTRRDIRGMPLSSRSRTQGSGDVALETARSSLRSKAAHVQPLGSFGLSSAGLKFWAASRTLGL